MADKQLLICQWLPQEWTSQQYYNDWMSSAGAEWNDFRTYGTLTVLNFLVYMSNVHSSWDQNDQSGLKNNQFD